MPTRLKPLAIAFSLSMLPLVFVASFSPTGFSADPPPKKAKNKFAGKVVTVYLSNPQDGAGQVLIDAELVTIGERLILVGTGADTGEDNNWTAGVRVGIAWDSVEIYYLMTQKQFDEKIKQHGN